MKKLIITKKELKDSIPTMVCLVSRKESGEFISNGGYSGLLTDISITVNYPVKSLTIKGDGTIELEIGKLKTSIV